MTQQHGFLKKPYNNNEKTIVTKNLPAYLSLLILELSKIICEFYYNYEKYTAVLRGYRQLNHFLKQRTSTKMK